jgi:hypothetical protein
MAIDDEVDDFLEHFGTKGMKWGVRKERTTGENDRAPVDKKALAKRVAIGAGILAAAAGAAYLASQNYKSTSTNSLSDSSIRAGSHSAKVIASEPTSIIYSGRRNSGTSFLKTGGVPSAIQEYDKAGFSDSSGEMFKRYGSNKEKVAAKFLDPDGRKDSSGRPIYHEVIVPASMSQNLNSVDDVVKETWPHLRDSYSEFSKEGR